MIGIDALVNDSLVGMSTFSLDNVVEDLLY